MKSKQVAFGFLYCADHAVVDVQKKIQLDLEHQARKSRQPMIQSQAPPPPPPAVSPQRQQRGTEDIEDDDVERITLDDMFVIDSAGEYSVSGDEADAPADDDDVRDGRSTQRDPDVRRRQDFKRFLSYLQSVECIFQETVSTLSSLIAGCRCRHL